MSKIPVKVVRVHELAMVPMYQTDGAAGFDLYCVEDVIVPPGSTTLIRTGLKLGIPQGYEVQVRPRSGLSAKTKMRVANSPGTIDSDYRGELMVIAENIDHSNGSPADYDRRTVRFRAGDRVAQGVLAEVPQAQFFIVEEGELSITDRGAGGFGSTGA